MEICKDCFSDLELKGFITSLANINNCSFCNNKNIETINIEELFDFFKELLDNFKLKPDGERLISKLQAHWSLFNNIDIGNKIINFVIRKIDTDIKSSEELIDFNDEIIENVNFWNELKEQLKWKSRYLTNVNFLTDDLGWDGFFESKITISESNQFYRARLHHKSNEPIYTSTQMFAPQKEISSAGRANPAGIPFLYLSDNEETILHEIRATYLDEVSIATFSLKTTVGTEIYISDFTTAPTLFHPNEVTKKIKSTLLKNLISLDLSKPMRRYDSELDYIPTQFICEFIKIFTGVHGIKFRSSVHSIGYNLVLFNQEIMECTDVKKVKVSQLDLAFRYI